MDFVQPVPCPPLGGLCDKRFDAVRTELERNFTERGELGASVCVMHEGRVVVDLWGGSATADGEQPWTRDTVVVVFSCTKGATSLCAHLLADAGELDLDAPVVRYWPSFGGNGRSEITVRMLLNHQAGLPGVSRRLNSDDLLDFDQMVKLMESERPLWRPGSRHGYHPITFGWLIGEVVRRVSGGITIGRFFDDQVARPLGLRFWIGLPEGEQHHVAELVMSEDGVLSPGFDEAIARGDTVRVAVANSLGGLTTAAPWRTRDALSAEIPAANGLANARALAAQYSFLANGGVADGKQLVSDDSIAAMAATESAGGEDAVTLEPARYSAGFEKATSGRANLARRTGLTLSESAFGYSGLGGSVGFADPLERLSFGYAMNRHPRAGDVPGIRYQPLIDATYRSLGYRSCASGKWAK